MTDPIGKHILYALFCLSRDTCPISAASLADAAGVTPTRAAEALLALEREGLVDASRLRLTMLGLAKAVSGGDARGGPQLRSRAAREGGSDKARSGTLPLAARDAGAHPEHS